MAYVLCLIYIAVVYIRPGELNSAFIDLHIIETTGIVASAIALFSVFFRPRPFFNLPIDWCFLGFCGAALLSNPTAGSLDQFSRTVMVLMPLVGFYALIRITVQSEGQLRGLVVVLCLLTVFQAMEASTRYFGGPGPDAAIAAAAPVPEFDDETGTGEVKRFQGTGLSGDPNDLAMNLLVVLPFLFTAVLSTGSGIVLRLAGLTGVGVIGYAMYLTQSRGGFLGLAALIGAYAYRRFGRVSAVAILAVVVVAALSAGPSRLQQIDSKEGSAQGRVQAWGAGLQMLKSYPVLGVGAQRFAVFHGRVAHNSFVDTFAELGFVGGFFFVGLFFWHMVGNGVARNVAGAASSTLARDLWVSGIGVIVCACFLSRQYIPFVYVPIVVGAARITIAQKVDSLTPLERDWDWIRIGLLSIGVVAATYVAVRVLAQYG